MGFLDSFQVGVFREWQSMPASNGNGSSDGG